MIGEATDGEVVLRLCEALAPDVVVIDVSMPGVSGIEVTRIIRRNHPNTRVLVLSVHAQEEIVLEALAAGAAGYVLKDAAAEELHQAVQAVARGGVYLSSAVSVLVTNRLPGNVGTRPALTAREREVVQLISEGLRLRQVATKLSISIATVKTHRASAMRKIGVDSTAQLVRYAIRTGLSVL